jgi:hypothetical protein
MDFETFPVIKIIIYASSPSSSGNTNGVSLGNQRIRYDWLPEFMPTSWKKFNSKN